MKIVSVNVGQPRDVLWNGTTVRTAIFKTPVAEPVAVRKLNLDGDRQADLTVHGGANKAIYAYPSEHYQEWRTELPEADLPWGAFGENLTTSGIREDSIYIGDRLRVGSAVLVVVQPRMPCYKLALRFDRDDMIRRFAASRRTGFYLAVEEEGELQQDSPIEFLSRDPGHVSVLDIFNLFMGANDPELLERAVQVQALPQEWKDGLRRRMQSRHASNT